MKAKIDFGLYYEPQIITSHPRLTHFLNKTISKSARHSIGNLLATMNKNQIHPTPIIKDETIIRLKMN